MNLTQLKWEARHQTAAADIIKPRPQQPRRSAGSFDSVFSDASRRQASSEPQAQSRPGAQPADRPERADSQNPQAPEAPADTGRPVAAAPQEQPAQGEDPGRNVERPQESEPVCEYALPMYAQALVLVAETLGMEPEALEQWLLDEGINLSELKEPANLPKFLEHALGIKTPADMLTEPAMPEIYKALHEAADMLKAPDEPQANAEAAPALGAKPKAPLMPAVQAALEGLQVTEEDGELVVSDLPEEAEEESAANPNPRQSQPAAARAQAPAQQQAPPPETAEAPAENRPSANPAGAAPADAQQQAQQTAQTAARPVAQQAPVNAQDVINQIMNQVKITTSGQQFTEMRMTLRPESLGEITLRVLTQNGIVMAQFEAESQRVKEALEANFGQLRDALTEAGISFGELNVFVRQDGQERLNQFERERQAARGRMAAVAAEEIEEPDNRDILHDGIMDLLA